MTNKPLKIGELAERTGLAPSTIRFYEQSGLLPRPERGTNGYRVYAPSDVERLRIIQLAQRLGFPLDSMRNAFASHTALSKDELLDRIDHRLTEITGLMATLQAQRKDLQTLQVTLRTAWNEGECLDVETLARGLGTASRRKRPSRRS